MASKKSLLKIFIATVFIFFCALSFLFAFTNFSSKASAELANGGSYVTSGEYDDIGGIHEDWFKTTRVTYTTTTEDGETKILSIVFDANGGVFPFGTKDGEMPSEIPTPTQGQQHRFVGWFTEDGVEVDANTQFTEDTTVYARWIAFEDKVVEYDGQSKLIEVDGVLPEGVTVTYYLNEVAVENVFNGATDSGQYNVIASFTSEESAISIESMSAVLTINKATVQAPVLNSKEYNGNNQTAEVETSELYSVTTNEGGTNVGSYDVVVTLTDSTNYKWADSVEETLTLSFEITKKKIEKPVGDEREYTYTGSEQQYEIIESDWYTVSNNKQTNAGNYTVTVALVDVDNTEWKDGTTEDLTFNFKIEKLKINLPEQDTREFTYTGNPQTYTIASSEYYEVQNNLQTNAGSYDVTVSLKDTANTIWSDDTADDKIFEFVIAKATYDMSDVDFESVQITYDGQLHSIEVSGTMPTGVSVKYYVNDLEFSGAKNAGEYLIVAKFEGNENYNDIADMSAVLTINKVTVQAPVLNSKEYNASSQTAEIAPSELYFVTTNEGGTGVGRYDVVLTLTDSTNYKWADSDEETLTLSFEITKKKIEKPVGDEREFTYTGSEQQYEIIESDWYTISNNKQTNAGNYTVTVTLVDVDNTEWKDGTTEDLTFNFKIEKLKINLPEQDTREFTYTGNPQTYTIASSEYYEVQNNLQTNAGSYDVTVSLKDTANTIWSDDTADAKIFEFVIAKATYAMSHIKFNDVTVVEDGQIKNITISGVLPEGVSVAYYLNNAEFMGVTDAGNYLIIAKFSHSNPNYNDIADMSAVLTINRANYEYKTDNDKSEIIIIPSAEGIDPDINIEIKNIEDDSEISKYLSQNEKLSKIYDITFYSKGAVVQPDGLLTIKILIPTELLNTNFKIIHIHDNSEYLELDYSIEGEYVVIETDKLSEFAFVYTVTPLTWLIIVLAVISILEGLFLILQIYKNKSKKVVKTLVVFPVFAFGLFIELWQFAVIWLLAGTAIVLLVSNIVYPFIKRKS